MNVRRSYAAGWIRDSEDAHMIVLEHYLVLLRSRGKWQKLA